MVPTPRRDERQNSRRNARRETNRAEILDAAEIVFAQTGIHNASMRSIAAEAGFSPAAMYLFFEGRQHLLAATLTRRGDELNELLTATVAEAPEPLAALHAVIDATLAFFARRTEFRQMLRELRGGPAIMGPALADHADDVDQRLAHAAKLLSGVIADGQKSGVLRSGNPHLLAHLYMVLVNEFVYLAAQPTNDFATEDLHHVVDGALRA